MNIQDIIDGKKQWRAHMGRVKALPREYQIVYHEIQKYLYKVGPTELSDGIDLLAGIVDLFEDGAAHGKAVLDVTGPDAAAFADDLIKDSPTYADTAQAKANDAVASAMAKSMGF
jgi:DNA-binding ferritin-like protein (Dps family)